MKIDRQKLYAVLTGDMVGFSRLAEQERIRLHQVMRQGSAVLRQAFGRAVPLDLDIFRGDSWQLLVAQPALSLRVGISYRVFMRVRMQSNHIDTRMAIAIGRIDYLPEDGISGADGEAFRRSGEALEAMPKDRRLTLARCQDDGKPMARAVDVAVQLVDHLAMRWTQKQAQAIAGALQGWTQEKIAKGWWESRITQQAVAQHLDRAGWSAVARALEFIEDLYRDSA
jgi:hypothetical protein